MEGGRSLVCQHLLMNLQYFKYKNWKKLKKEIKKAGDPWFASSSFPKSGQGSVPSGQPAHCKVFFLQKMDDNKMIWLSLKFLVLDNFFQINLDDFLKILDNCRYLINFEKILKVLISFFFLIASFIFLSLRRSIDIASAMVT